MAAAIKAINAKIRSNKALDYFCSTRTFYLGHKLADANLVAILSRDTVACPFPITLWVARNVVAVSTKKHAC